MSRNKTTFVYDKDSELPRTLGETARVDLFVCKSEEHARALLQAMGLTLQNIETHKLLSLEGEFLGIVGLILSIIGIIYWEISLAANCTDWARGMKASHEVQFHLWVNKWVLLVCHPAGDFAPWDHPGRSLLFSGFLESGRIHTFKPERKGEKSFLTLHTVR